MEVANTVNGIDFLETSGIPKSQGNGGIPLLEMPAQLMLIATLLECSMELHNIATPAC